jgi:hypothetical protein
MSSGACFRLLPFPLGDQGLAVLPVTGYNSRQKQSLTTRVTQQGSVVLPVTGYNSRQNQGHLQTRVM